MHAGETMHYIPCYNKVQTVNNPLSFEIYSFNARECIIVVVYNTHLWHI